jgi:hypothetical protein
MYLLSSPGYTQRMPPGKHIPDEALTGEQLYSLLLPFIRDHASPKANSNVQEGYLVWNAGFDQDALQVDVIL